MIIIIKIKVTSERRASPETTSSFIWTLEKRENSAVWRFENVFVYRAFRGKRIGILQIELCDFGEFVFSCVFIS